MPGRVIDLVTKVGEHVKAGQKLLVTEAMKLETVIKAPIDGHRARDRRRRRRERGGRRSAGRHRRRSGGVKLFRFGAPGAEKPGRAPARRRARRRRRASASDWDEAFFARRRPGAAARWVGQRRGARRRACPPARAWRPAVARPSKLVCIGLNYRDHARESGAALPGEPIVFLKATSALAGPDDDLRLPVGGEKTDWEVELALVIGARAKYVARRGRDEARRRLRPPQRLLRARLPARARTASGRRARAPTASRRSARSLSTPRRAARLRVGAPVAEGQRRDASRTATPPT